MTRLKWIVRLGILTSVFFCGIALAETSGSSDFPVENGVVINSDNFPDDNFRSIVSGYDTDEDGILSEDEACTVTSINCEYGNIATLVGIEYFTNLHYLYCDYNELSILDVSGNSFLKELHCAGNHLSQLNIDTCTSLETLYCYKNNLTSLDVSNCPALEILDCNTNNIFSLVIGNKPALYHLCFNINQVSELDVSGCPVLENLYGYRNALTSIDLSNNTALVDLSLWANNLTELDVTHNTALESFRCYQNNLSELDVSQNPLLGWLHCEENNLTVLDVSRNTQLYSLGCEGNNIATLDVSNAPTLCSIVANNERLTYNGEYDYLSSRFTFSFDINVTVIANDLISYPIEDIPGSPILTVSTDASSYDYAQAVVLTAAITNADGTIDGLVEAYPNAYIRATLLTDTGSVVSGFIIQETDGILMTCQFPLASDELQAGDYKILVETNVAHLSAVTPSFYYTADKSNVPDSAGCSVSLSLNTASFTLNEKFRMQASVTDATGNPVNGIKVLFEVLDLQHNVVNDFFDDYSGLWNLTTGEGTCTISHTEKMGPGGTLKAGKYIARATISETGLYDEQLFEYTLNELQFPTSLETVEAEAFSGIDCQAVVIPNGCESIGPKAFSNCKSLLYIVIPASVTYIADDAFEGCNEYLVIERIN